MNIIIQLRVFNSLTFFPSYLNGTRISCVGAYIIDTCHKKHIHTSDYNFAGHSKWQYIRHTKAANDKDRSAQITNYFKEMRQAIKESGGPDPKVNMKLARIIAHAKYTNVPAATIQNQLKSLEKTNDKATTEFVTLAAPGGIFIVVEVYTDKLKHSLNSLQAVNKRYNLRLERGFSAHLFQDKGVISALVGKAKTLQIAEDNAIELGAEEVEEEDGLLIFTCEPANFDHLLSGLEQRNYKIEYSGIDKIPLLPIELGDEEWNKFTTVTKRLRDELDFVVRIYHNF